MRLRFTKEKIYLFVFFIVFVLASIALPIMFFFYCDIGKDCQLGDARLGDDASVDVDGGIYLIRIIYFYDIERDADCWILLGHKRGGISCVHRDEFGGLYPPQGE